MSRRDEGGFMAAEWVAAVGLLLIPLFIVVTSAMKVPETKAAVQTIATEAARAGAQQDSCTAARAAAVQTAKDLATQFHVTLDSNALTYSANASNDWKADGVFTVKANVKPDLVLLPGAYTIQLPASMSASHSEPIDRFRFITEGRC